MRYRISKTPTRTNEVKKLTRSIGSIKEKIDEGNKRANCVNEMDRMMGELYRSNLPHATKEHLNKWYEDKKS